MKKFLSILLSFLLGVGACVIAGTNFSHATGDDRTYLIEPTFSTETDYQTTYNIEENEVFLNLTPTSITGVLPGASIKPKSENADKSFDKTYLMKSPGVAATSSQSLFINLFWNGEVIHNLKIIASDGTNSVEWTLTHTRVVSELNVNTSSSKIRYGWVSVELPVSSDLTITSLRLVYAEGSDDIGTYSNVYFYAPYIANKQHQDITFSSKQKYYNYSVKFGNYDYVDEKMNIASANDLFEYCFIGDINYLQNPTDDFYFIITVTNNGTGSKVSQTLKIGTFDFQYIFNESSNYEIVVELYNSFGEALWVSSKSYNIRDFVALYLDYGLPRMEKGQTISYEINLSPLLFNIHDLQAVSSNNKIATAEIRDGKIYVTANGRGMCNITISVVGQKGIETEKKYTSTYSVEVREQSVVNWWLLGGIAIFLIVAGILVYTIMVKRRLIKGRYPKY